MSDPFDEMAEAVAPMMPEDGFEFPGYDQLEEEFAEKEESPPVAPDPAPEHDHLADLVFDPRYVNDFEGLMFIGALTTTFDCFGHEIVLRTLTVDELLQVGLMTKQYEGTLGSDRAYITAIAASCIETVDGMPLVTPLGPGAKINQQKFKFVRENWYFWTTDRVYQEFRALELRVQRIVDAMGEASS